MNIPNGAASAPTPASTTHFDLMEKLDSVARLVGAWKCATGKAKRRLEAQCIDARADFSKNLEIAINQGISA